MIGMFDSGSGGLTVLHALRQRAKDADIVYFGDIANAPYGEKSLEELAQLTAQGIAVLRERGATVLVSACNSVSTSVLAGAAGDMPFIEMSRPAAQYMLRYKGKKFLLIATPATIASGLYQQALNGIVVLEPLATAGLAGAIEFGAPEATITTLITEALSSARGRNYDGLMLGCTHYPLVRPQIESVARERFGALEIIDPAHAVADAVATGVDTHGAGGTAFLISKDSLAFRDRVNAMFVGAGTIEIIPTHS